MQTIYRTVPASNFTLNANDLISKPMPFKAKEILLYLLSKPKDWRVKVADIRLTLELTTHTIRQSLLWLQQAGYAGYIRLKTGHTIWKVFSEPQTGYRPDGMPQTVSPHMAKPSVIQINKEQKEIKKQQPVVIAPLIATPMEIIPVVVSSESIDELIYPPQIKDTTPLRKKLNKIKPEVVAKTPAIKQEVLFELAYRMTLQKLHSVPAFLNTLVTAVNDGTFTRTATKQAAGASISSKAHIDTQQTIKQQQQSKASASAPDVSRAGFAGLKMAIRTA
jgi:hypothetical protein